MREDLLAGPAFRLDACGSIITNPGGIAQPPIRKDNDYCEAYCDWTPCNGREHSVRFQFILLGGYERGVDPGV